MCMCACMLPNSEGSHLNICLLESDIYLQVYVDFKLSQL